MRNVGDRPPITTIGDRRIASVRVLTNGGESEEVVPTTKTGFPITTFGKDRIAGFPMTAFGNDRITGFPMATFGKDTIISMVKH